MPSLPSTLCSLCVVQSRTTSSTHIAQRQFLFSLSFFENCTSFELPKYTRTLINWSASLTTARGSLLKPYIYVHSAHEVFSTGAYPRILHSRAQPNIKALDAKTKNIYITAAILKQEYREASHSWLYAHRANWLGCLFSMLRNIVDVVITYIDWKFTNSLERRYKQSYVYLWYSIWPMI